MPNCWNNEWANKRAGSSDGVYWRLLVKGQTIGAHRIAWLYVYGKLPERIDHIDGDSFNNIISNLREATVSQNKINSKISTRNTSGVVGVSFKPERNNWRASIHKEGKTYELGSYKCKEDAIAARKAAEPLVHGEFVRK